MSAAAVWLIWSHDHAAYWRADRAGYTNDLHWAGRYSFVDAASVCRGGGNARAWSGVKKGPWEVMHLAPEADEPKPSGDPCVRIDLEIKPDGRLFAVGRRGGKRIASRIRARNENDRVQAFKRAAERVRRQFARMVQP